MIQDIYQRARENYQDSVDAASEERARMVEDLHFSNPANPRQWDDKIRLAREQDPGGARPTFCFDQTNQYIAQVVNDSRMNKPQLQTIPASTGANEKVAGTLDGIIRHIEYRSSAYIAYDTALEHAARIGLGWMRVLPVVIDTKTNAQEIRIAAIHDPLSVKHDPHFRMPDGSDQSFGFIESSLSLAAFERQYGKRRKPKNWESDRSGWYGENTVRICEYFEVIEEKQNHLVIEDSDSEKIIGERTSLSEDEYWETSKKTGVRLKVSGTFANTKRRVRWYKMDGNDFLEDATDFPSRWIPLVPVMGYESWIEGKRYLCGMVRRMMAGQQAYNLERNSELEWMAKQPKSPFIVAWESVSEHQREWANANTGSAAYLPYDHIDGEGNPLPSPQRINPPNPGSSFQNLGQKGLADIQASIGMYRANLGAPSNETSGIAIKRREQQGDTANFHYIDNLSRSLTHLGRIIVDMIPKVMDTKRAARILQLDGKSEEVIINPKMRESFKVDRNGKKVVEINLTTGEYDVRCKVGPAYASLREEAAESLTRIVQTSPQLMAVLGPMWARMQDWPEAEKTAKLLLAMAPPQVQAIESGDVEIPPQVMAAMQQKDQQLAELQQAMQAMQQQLVQAQQAMQQKDMDQSALVQKASIESEAGASIAIERANIDAAATLQKAQIDAATKIVIARLQEEAEARAKERELMLSQAMQAQQLGLEPATVIVEETTAVPDTQAMMAEAMTMIAQAMAAQSAPEPPKQIIHERSPDGLLLRSYEAPLEASAEGM